MCKTLRWSIMPLVLSGLVGTGCALSLKHRPLTAPSSPAEGRLSVLATAQGMEKDNGKTKGAGWGTFTPFAIPVAKVHVEGQPSRDLMAQIADAVKTAGYEAQVVESPGVAEGLPTVTCDVRKLKFRNYTWLFPLVFNWGRVAVDVAVVSPDGKTLWSKSYTGKGKGFYSFNSTASKAMTRMLDQIVADFSSPAFREAVFGA